jgi:exopolyphosphatase/guanosine-5'-triphosphate,3'-diphosphate pyrophosphatase
MAREAEPVGGRRGAREAAVIDVGSNSVRLVVYRVSGRAIVPILNEKSTAGLGRGVRQSGRLGRENVDLAVAALRRFRLMIDAMGVPEVHAVATAAVREAEDGSAFIERVRRDANIPLQRISGAEEARLSALGVLAGAPDARGVVGDLGGSSLELIRVTPEGPKMGETHPLGPLSLMNGPDFDPRRVSAQIGEALRHSQALPARGQAFYAVGGAWRALARAHMVQRDYPLRVLQHYEIARADAQAFAAFMASQSRKSLERMEDATAKRAESLPYAASVLAGVLGAGDFRTVIMSSYGLREGLLYELMHPGVRLLDPLVEGAAALIGDDRAIAFGRQLESWVEPLFAALKSPIAHGREETLRAAACRLADIGAALHPDSRGEISFDLVLHAPMSGVSHSERAFLAASVLRRYSRRLDDPRRTMLLRLMPADHLARAEALGAAMRLGADLSARSAGLLAAVRLELAGQKLKLTPAKGMGHLLTDHTAKRAQQLAQALGLIYDPA